MAESAGVTRAVALAALAGALALAACGKVGPPQPPGPPDRITWPHTYPKPRPPAP